MEIAIQKHPYAKTSFSKIVNPLPAEYENKIICTDALVGLLRLPDNCIDAIITSPPYNFGMKYDVYNDGLEWKQYMEQLSPILLQCIRVLKYSGRLIINIQPGSKSYFPTHHAISSFLMDKGMIWKTEIIWNKHSYKKDATAWGSFASPSSPYFCVFCEFIEVFCKGDIVKKGKREDIDITKEEFMEWIVPYWAIGTEGKMETYNHPAMFPERLVGRCLKLFTYKNDIILDPFNGAGTTTAVSFKMNRRYLGIDISQDYCNTARRRIESLLF